MKFIKQRYVDLYPQQSKNQQRSREVSFNSSRVNPEIHTFQAINDLKKSEDHIDSLKRRLSYLKIHEDRNIQRVHQNQRKIDVHYHAQELVRKDKLRKLKYFDSVRRSIDDMKEKNDLEKKTREYNLREARYKIKSSNIKDVEMTKKRSEQIAKTIKNMKEEDHVEKRLHRDIVAQEEEQARIKVRLNSAKRMQDIHSSRALETSKIQQKKLNRELQMLELSRLEAQMIERQSKSKIVCEESQKRLKSVRRQTGKTARSQKSTDKSQSLLPEITSRNKHNTHLIII